MADTEGGRNLTYAPATTTTYFYHENASRQPISTTSPSEEFVNGLDFDGGDDDDGRLALSALEKDNHPGDEEHVVSVPVSKTVEDTEVDVIDESPPLLLPEVCFGPEVAEEPSFPGVTYYQDEQYLDEPYALPYYNDEAVRCECGVVMSRSEYETVHLPEGSLTCINGFAYYPFSPECSPKKSVRPYKRSLRRVSQVRVKTATMSLEELESSLNKKMIEKLGRQVPVSLVDKQHALCGICNAIVSLNKKFEVVHLVRHINAWHPSAHKCSRTWGTPRMHFYGPRAPLSDADFRFIDTGIGRHDSIQCLLCDMLMDPPAVGMHYTECHPLEIEVPKCNLCLQELLISARIQVASGRKFTLYMPDEYHIRCDELNASFVTEQALDRALKRYIKQLAHNGEPSEAPDEEAETPPESALVCPKYTNSRMNFGRRSKPKRHFVMPALRQAVPNDSQYVEPVSDCHWKCKLCDGDILAAVISAGTIKHYRDCHPDELNDCQMELCKVRLSRLSKDCMKFVDPSTIECLICKVSYPLHKPFNMCRAVRHLKGKHPDHMPEYEGVGAKTLLDYPQPKRSRLSRSRHGYGIKKDDSYNLDVTSKYLIRDEGFLNDLRRVYQVDFAKALHLPPEVTMGDDIYVVVTNDVIITEDSVSQIVQQVEASELNHDGSPYVVLYLPEDGDETMLDSIKDEAGLEIDDGTDAAVDDQENDPDVVVNVDEVEAAVVPKVEPEGEFD